MIRYRNKLMPPADVNNMKHNFGQANPIRHYRLGNDCSCEIVHKLPYKEPSLLNNSYTKDYCPANSALKKYEIQEEVQMYGLKVIVNI